MMNAKNVIEKAKVTAMCAVPAIMACPLVAHAAEGDVTSLADQAGQVLTTAIGDMTTSISNHVHASGCCSVNCYRFSSYRRRKGIQAYCKPGITKTVGGLAFWSAP